MDPSTTSVIRDVFLIVAAGLLAALCLVLIVVILKLYRPIRETVSNSRQTTDNLSRITTDFSKNSQETSENLAQTSRNLVNITEKARETTEELTPAIQAVGEAASGIGSAAATATRVAEMIGRLIPQGTGTGATTSGVGGLLRLVRGLFSGPRNEGNRSSGSEA